MFRIGFLLLLLGLQGCVGHGLQHNQTMLTESGQLVVVVANHWDSPVAQMYTFQANGSGWQATDITGEVNIGRNGLAWGIGLHPPQTGLHKQEGDGRAPAGVFALGDAFGYLQSVNTGLNYAAMQAGDYCIDVNGSPYYNQIVNQQTVGDAVVAESTEPMRRDIHKQQNIYKKGIVVQHNPANLSGQGSCIFMHLWFGPNVATAGCTSMPEARMDALLHWLDAGQNPRMVLLTRDVYQDWQIIWGLPPLPGDEK